MLLRCCCELLGGRCDLPDDIADVLHHGVEVRCELSELVLRGDRQVGLGEVALCQRVNVMHETCGCLGDRRCKPQEGEDDDCDEQDADRAQSAVGDLEAVQLGEGDALGFYVRRQGHAGGFLSGYFVGGQSLGAFVLAMTMVATYSSVSSFVGGPGMAYEIGFGWIYMAVIQTMTIFLVLGIFGKRIARLAHRINAVTIVDIIRYRYQSDALAAIAACGIVVFFAASMVAQFVGGAQLFAAVTGYSYELGLILFGFVVVVYISIGGFRAVALTYAYCAIVMILGVVLLFYYVLEAAGGLMPSSHSCAPHIRRC